MTNEQINKLITEEAFGECWHEFEGKESIIRHCYKCGVTIYNTIDGVIVDLKKNPDFFTLEGCMKLFLKIQEMEWFREFAEKRLDAKFMCDCGDCNDMRVDLHWIHPDRLAPAVAEFLEGRK